VHGLPVTPSVQSMVDGYPRRVWLNQAGDEVVESYSITHTGHGTPLATGEADDECGAAGPFLLEVGISSSYYIAKFFGLTIAGLRNIGSTKGEAVRIAPEQRPISRPAGLAQTNLLDGQVLERQVLESEMLESEMLESEVLESEVLESEVLDKDYDMSPKHANIPPLPIDIGAVINRALKAAGLM
jgi:hypothetical protein